MSHEIAANRAGRDYERDLRNGTVHDIDAPINPHVGGDKYRIFVKVNANLGPYRRYKDFYFVFRSRSLPDLEILGELVWEQLAEIAAFYEVKGGPKVRSFTITRIEHG